MGRHDDGVLAVAVTPQGLVVSGGVDGAVRLWDPHNPGENNLLSGHGSLAPDEMLVPLIAAPGRA